MAQSSVKTVQFIDPRIEPQPDPVYNYVIGPMQNQYYKIAASGLSDSAITFNNLTTLGSDRAYLDTFEIEITAELIFHIKKWPADTDQTVANWGNAARVADDSSQIVPQPGDWTFQSWPLNTCADSVRVNINGGAFFSQPLYYIRAKERYMNQSKLAECYENCCPWQKPILQTESGRSYNVEFSQAEDNALYAPTANANTLSNAPTTVPSRYPRSHQFYGQSSENIKGGYNNGFMQPGAPSTLNYRIGYDNYYRSVNPGGGGLPANEKTDETHIIVTWREPIFASPFSSRYDANYGRPLYNITSLDITYTLMNLKNMILLTKGTCIDDNLRLDPYVADYEVHLKSADLCYQVMTIPPTFVKPLTTLVPYRRFVPYITDYPATLNATTGDKGVTFSSGVYTFNEIPTAVWLFVAPSLKHYQNAPACYRTPANDREVAHPRANIFPNWDSNKLFAFIRNVDISLANTTQILSTASERDLYRIAKTNGCCDSFWSWNIAQNFNNTELTTMTVRDISLAARNANGIVTQGYLGSAKACGAGSVLRLVPGVDMIVPDQPLIPGANAFNMVFKANVKVDIPPHPTQINDYSLWLIFEYVGVAAISPGQCEISMNPLGSGEIMQASPVMSATSQETEGEIEGSGAWDKVKNAAKIAAQLADSGIISRLLKNIPSAAAQDVAAYAEAHGFGAPGAKRPRGGAIRGGATMGKGLKDWI